MSGPGAAREAPRELTRRAPDGGSGAPIRLDEPLRFCATLFEAHARGTLPVTLMRPSNPICGACRARSAAGLDGAAHLAHRKVIVHDDGTSLWTLTHASDVARPCAERLEEWGDPLPRQRFGARLQQDEP